MKNKLLTALLISLLLSGCSVDNGTVSDVTSVQTTTVTAAESETALTESTAETSVTEEEPPEEVTEEEIIEVVTEASAETEEEIEEDEFVPERRNVSEDNIFIDFTFEYTDGVTDIGELGEKAEKFLAESEFYTEYSEEQIVLLKEMIESERKFYNENPDSTLPVYQSAFFEYFDDNDRVVPHLYKAYPYDYDGDGSEETFMIVNMPYCFDRTPCLRNYLIFADSSGNMSIVDDFSYVEEALILDYGICRHIVFGGAGIMGADSHTVLFGVKDNEAVKHYYGRLWFEKDGCLLGAYGWQSTGGTMYYDTSAREYRHIVGETVSAETLKEMDTNGDIAEFIGYYENNEVLGAFLIGGKYYCLAFGFMDIGTVYTYEDGRFVPSENKAVRFTSESKYEIVHNVLDIDLNKAYDEMVSPEEAVQLMNK